MTDSLHTVAEMPGLYGPFTMHERVVQKIWLQQDFAATACTLLDGRKLEILAPGRWNLLGGPDFKQAALRIDGQELRGDVEVHFHASDWSAHGHRHDQAYADVVLHVLLYPPESESPPPRRADGKVIPALVLLPLLHRDLEEYAADDALETLTARDEWRRVAELANQSLEKLRAQLRQLAARRWAAKVASAHLRIGKLGWRMAAHTTALEILGYRRNRVPMLIAAERWPLAAWQDPMLPPAVLNEVAGWEAHGVRPANQPATRLRQYGDWVRAVPDWPDRLLNWGDARKWEALLEEQSTAQARRAVRLTAVGEQLAAEVLGHAVAGPRFHTLVCDGFLPLLAAAREREALRAAWFHWFPGDLPEEIRRHLSSLEVTRAPDQPLCHGYAQGLLAWLIEREIRA